MDELVAQAVSIVDAANGSILYSELLAAWPAEQRGNLPRVLKQARANGLLTQEVALVNGVVTHTYKKV